MKLCNYYRLLLFFIGFFSACINAEFVAVPGVRIWDLIAELGYETNTILSKVCNIEAQVAINCCSEIAAIDSKIDVLESLVENQTNCCSEIAAIDSKIDVFESLVENQINCCSEITAIDSKINVVESIVAINCCAIINSKISVVESIIENQANCCSEVTVIDSKIDVLESLFDTIDFTGTSTISQPFVSIYGDQIAEQRFDNISVQFQYGIPSSMVATYTQGGGTVTTANSAAILSTAASATSIAQLQTKNTIGYRSGHEAYAYVTVAFTGSFTATSSQFIGPIDYQNGFAVGFNGTTFGVTRRVNTVNTFTPQSSFNGDRLDGTGASGFTYNPALLNVFRIGYGYLGSSIIKFQIMSSNGNWITFHTIEYPNSAATPSINQPFLPITARVENIAGTSVLSMSTVSWNAGIVGSPNTSSYRYFATNNTVTPGLNIETHLLTIRNSAVFNNQRNVIRVRLSGASARINSAAPAVAAAFRLRKNATVTGTSYSNVDTNNSVIQVSTAGAYVAATGTTTFMQWSKGVPTVFIPSIYNVYLLPGETLTVTITNSSAIAATCQIMWEEQF